LGYEDAAPTPRRGSYFGDATTGARRNSIVGRIMNWAEQVHQDHAHGDSTGTNTTRRVSGNGAAGSRRGSFIGGGGGGPARARAPSRDDDEEVLDEHGNPIPQPAKSHTPFSGADQELLFDEHGNPIPKSAAAPRKGHFSRRNSLQDMLDKAMAFVNLRPTQFNQEDDDEDADDNDLSPFGTRRDSLFSTC
jgi:hypothetical protein